MVGRKGLIPWKEYSGKEGEKGRSTGGKVDWSKKRVHFMLKLKQNVKSKIWKFK